MTDTESLTLPLPLTNALESGECVLFIGAGVGACMFDQKGAPAPNGTEVALELATHFNIELDSTDLASPSLSKIAQVVEIRKGRRELLAYLTARFADLTPSDPIIGLTERRWKAIFTTNYDRAIEQAF